jgi:hypothetical protein
MNAEKSATVFVIILVSFLVLWNSKLSLSVAFANGSG